jgi:hypothetical protein
MTQLLKAALYNFMPNTMTLTSAELRKNLTGAGRPRIRREEEEYFDPMDNGAPVIAGPFDANTERP